MRSVLLACSLLVLSVVSGCTSLDPTVIAVLAADQDARLQQPLDADVLVARVEEICDGCTVEIHDAAGSADTQSEQLDEALAASADVVILDAVDPVLAEDLVQRADTVPVVALGAPVRGMDWLVGLSDSGVDTEDVDDADDADSVLEAARDVVVRELDSFEFVPSAQMSTKAADVAVGVLVGDEVGGSVDYGGVPSWSFEPVEVTVNDLTSVLVARGAITLDELCAGATARRCVALGLV